MKKNLEKRLDNKIEVAQKEHAKIMVKLRLVERKLNQLFDKRYPIQKVRS